MVGLGSGVDSLRRFMDGETRSLIISREGPDRCGRRRWCGKIGAGGQRVGLFRAPLVGRNGRVPPLVRLAVLSIQTGARDTDHRPECSHHLSLAMAVLVASPYNRSASDAGLGKLSPFIAVPPKRDVGFRFQEFLDEAANAAP